jgi:hypothetical protein
MSVSPGASVTIADVIEAARRSRGLLAPETAGYLVLGAADQLIGAPRVPDERRSRVLVDGGRVVVAASATVAPAEAELALRRLLRELLQVAHGSAPALGAVAEAGPKGSIEPFIAELESALIPVNRSAASRALARLARESLRARVLGPRPEQTAAPAGAHDEGVLPDSRALDIPDRAKRARPLVQSDPFVEEPVTTPRLAQKLSGPASSEIDELLLRAVASTPPPPPREPVRMKSSSAPLPGMSSRPPSARGVDELLETFAVGEARPEDWVAWDARPPMGAKQGAGLGADAGGAAARAAKDLAASSMRDAADAKLAREPVPAPSPADRSRPSLPVPGRSMPSLLEERAPSRRSSRVGRILAVLALLAALAGAALLLRRKPGSLSGRTPDAVEAERRAAAAVAASAAARASAGPCRASVLVTDVPQGAEVLVRSGIAPIDVERIPSGARLEFVATSDGYSPRRAVIPQGAAWDQINGKPRFELGIQLERSRAKAGVLDPWPAGEPGSTVGGNGPPGTVHVVTTPRGAEVWMVAGAGPDTTIEALPCAVGLELLVAGSAQGQPFRRRLRVDASALTPEASANTIAGRISASP